MIEKNPPGAEERLREREAISKIDWNPRRRHWYHYALERLPLSLLITAIFVVIGFPLLSMLAMLLLRLLT